MIHTCNNSKIIMDKRQDNDWYPPQQEERPRCITCGWQGKWRKPHADISN